MTGPKPGDFQRRIEARMNEQLAVPVRRLSFSEYLVAKYMPDSMFEGVMQGMVDSHWLRERAESVAASGDPFSNEKAAALFEAADAAETASASADAAP